ncbi:MAG: hypothetical protein U0324_39110 [Polyangiales bacterium]
MPVRADFPIGWVGTPLPGDRTASLTYAAALEPSPPTLEAAFDGSFAWLPPMEPAVRRRMEPHWRSDADRCTLASSFEPAVAEATSKGFALPEGFLHFMRSTELQQRVPSPTACYFDAPERIVEAPAPGDGVLVRFLNDQQWCQHWYLYVERGGAHAVVTSPYALDCDFLDDGGGNDGAPLLLCAPDFERFVYRLWLEGSAWFALALGHRALTPAEARYVAEAAREGDVPTA